MGCREIDPTNGIYLCFEEGADDLLLVHVISMEGEEEGEMVYRLCCLVS